MTYDRSSYTLVNIAIRGRCDRDHVLAQPGITLNSSSCCCSLCWCCHGLRVSAAAWIVSVGRDRDQVSVKVDDGGDSGPGDGH